jgi:hypothetical protein
MRGTLKLCSTDGIELLPPDLLPDSISMCSAQRWPKRCFYWKVFSLKCFTCVNLVLTELYLAKYLLNSAKLTPDSPRSENL